MKKVKVVSSLTVSGSDPEDKQSENRKASRRAWEGYASTGSRDWRGGGRGHGRCRLFELQARLPVRGPGFPSRVRDGASLIVAAFRLSELQQRRRPHRWASWAGDSKTVTLRVYKAGSEMRMAPDGCQPRQ